MSMITRTIAASLLCVAVAGSAAPAPAGSAASPPAESRSEWPD